jgi:hypothetical protein
MTARAPRTGNNAAQPGKGVCTVKANAATAIAASPTQDSAARRAMWPSARGSIARRPPAPNSHARVGVTKYAAAGLAAVLDIE